MTRVRTILRRTTKWVLTPPAVLAVAVGAVVLAFAIQARVRLPELKPWHTVRLAEEFRAGRRDAPKSFEEYLKLEDRLFAELQRRIVDDPVAVLPEYDPYKYNSFPVNAANQIYLLTKRLQKELIGAGERQTLGRMPRVLAFQSLVDATILASDVVSGLLARGEAGAMIVPLDTLARLRSNPFFDVIRDKIKASLETPAP